RVRRPARPYVMRTTSSTTRSSRSSAWESAAITSRSRRSLRDSPGAAMPEPGEPETADLQRLRRRIDALDRRIVRLLNDRAALAREVGAAKSSAGRRRVRDAEREREVLLRVSMANAGPMPQADLIAVYRRLFAVARS